MKPISVLVLALVLGAVALLLLAGVLLLRLAREGRSAHTLAQALDQRAAAAAAAAVAAAARNGAVSAAAGASSAAPAAAVAAAAAHATRWSMFNRWLRQLSQAGVRWLETPLGRLIVADEDRRLLEQSGFVETRSRGLFLVARLLCAVLLPLLVGLLANHHLAEPHYSLLVLLSTLGGFMLPKLYIRRRAAARRDAVVDELPMLVDLLRLLQGVGLSLDQSLQVMVNDFRGVQPVLSSELEIAQRQFAAGRTREQSLQRLVSSFGNEDLRAIVRLLIQVDRHGGAVQEPLKQFGERLRETRRALLRERIGRLTVKMTGVMIVTLLPALLIVTAGPGVLAVTKTLSSLHR
ncbi:type II secretion system F family protein [Paraburkholderia bonniea]|uniref:type II secretion system F family protein n=1 Tax=Paraburkholderia bonniea TaxID=2152891 RepID=UPI00129102EF|nr:type II secretion system F family protein [Paraburkholderia bonniea]WJF91287.1 type II secretion system F family protein [Paraburkholderia bonniea]WJF94602.1 type II secretion system F family protein [Paraburkholderia bonniea]